MFYKKMFLKVPQNPQEKTSARKSFLIELQAWGLRLIKKDFLAQVFSCEFCWSFKNTFFTKYLLAIAFGRKTSVKDLDKQSHIWILVKNLRWRDILKVFHVN